MHDLPLADGIPVLRLPRVGRLPMPLPPPESPPLRVAGRPVHHPPRLVVSATRDGGLAMRWKGSFDAAFWDGDLRRPMVLRVGDPTHCGLDALHGRVAVASRLGFRLLDADGTERCALDPAPGASDASVRFNADGSLWYLQGFPSGTAVLCLLSAEGEVLDRVDLDHEMSGGPAYWLEETHPALSCVVVSAGMGEDGAFQLVVRAVDGRMAVEPPSDGICFAGWRPDGAGFMTLPHYGSRLEMRGLDGGVLHARDLDPILEELDDTHTWRAHMLDGASGTVLLPTSEGRLLQVPMDGEITEWRLEGDERNYDWLHVQILRGGTLLAGRGCDPTLGQWRMP